MTRRTWLTAGVLVLLAAGCGKKGNPLPPLRPIPARISDVSVTRGADGVELRFTVPAANVDGTTPAAVDRVDVYAIGVVAGAPAPTAAAVYSDLRNLRSRVPVRRAVQDAAPLPAPPAPAAPAPGEPVRVIDRLQWVGDPPPATVYLVTIPVVGSGRGRQGPPSAPVAVPLGALPLPPTGLSLTHDESSVRAVWQPSAPGQVFRAVRTTASGVETSGSPPLTAAPVTQPDLAFPVEFGREVCMAVRALTVSGSVSLQGAWSSPACLTPVDRYPPAAPAGLQTVQEGTAVTLIWNAVDASDLRGYVVLRGVGEGDNLQPLMRDPIRETTFRDATVQAGTLYTYAVYAVDNAPAPNISQLSARQTVTVR